MLRIAWLYPTLAPDVSGPTSLAPLRAYSKCCLLGACATEQPLACTWDDPPIYQKRPMLTGQADQSSVLLSQIYGRRRWYIDHLSNLGQLHNIAAHKGTRDTFGGSISDLDANLGQLHNIAAYKGTGFSYRTS